MLSELAAWLRQQAEADKTAAEAATPGPWVFEGDDPTDDELYSTHDENVLPTVAWTRDRQVANGQHMERHDPLTEAARADAVLEVLRFYDLAVTWEKAEGKPLKQCEVLGIVIRQLAAGYRHREGYKREWAR